MGQLKRAKNFRRARVWGSLSQRGWDEQGEKGPALPLSLF